MKKLLILVVLISSFAKGQIVPVGTVGNGVSDDSKALTDWLNTGTDLYLPEGTYRITKQLLLSAARAYLTIKAHPKAKIVAATTYWALGGGMIQITATEQVEIQGLTMAGNSPTTTTLDAYHNNAYSIWVVNASSVKVKDCHFTYQPKGSLRTDDCDSVEKSVITLLEIVTSFMREELTIPYDPMFVITLLLTTPLF